VTLSDEEIRRAVARAEASPRDRELQFNLGRALYFYASQTRSAKILPDAERLIRRAHELQSDDEAATVMLGNVLFDLGQNTDAVHFAEARKYYLEALKAKPSDADVLMDVGRTFYYERPARPQRAIEFYRRALAVNPQHEATLQNLINALLDVGNITEAEAKLKDLQTVNPQNAMLPNLSARLEQARNAGR
jgi:tetratricopeptide (TPR) repeat protein